MIKDYPVKYEWQRKHPFVNARKFTICLPRENCVDNYYSNYSIEFLDKNKYAIKTYVFEKGYAKGRMRDKEVLFLDVLWWFDDDYGYKNLSGIGLYGGNEKGIGVSTRRKFWLLLNPGLDVLRNTHSVQITFSNRP